MLVYDLRQTCRKKGERSRTATGYTDPGRSPRPQLWPGRGLPPYDLRRKPARLARCCLHRAPRRNAPCPAAPNCGEHAPQPWTRLTAAMHVDPSRSAPEVFMSPVDESLNPVAPAEMEEAIATLATGHTQPTEPPPHSKEMVPGSLSHHHTCKERYPARGAACIRIKWYPAYEAILPSQEVVPGSRSHPHTCKSSTRHAEPPPHLRRQPEVLSPVRESLDPSDQLK